MIRNDVSDYIKLLVRIAHIICNDPIFLVSEGLLSYSMPQGVQRGTEVDLSDRTYDGHEESGYLSGGLGQLVDGQKGQDIFRLDLKGHGKGKLLFTFTQKHLLLSIYKLFANGMESVTQRRRS